MGLPFRGAHPGLVESQETETFSKIRVFKTRMLGRNEICADKSNTAEFGRYMGKLGSATGAAAPADGGKPRCILV